MNYLHIVFCFINIVYSIPVDTRRRFIRNRTTSIWHRTTSHGRWNNVVYLREYLLRSVTGLFLLEMPVNLSQYRRSVRMFNNRNLFVQSKISSFTYLSDSNNNNLAIRSLILLNKIGLVLLLLTLMFAFKVNASKHKKNRPFWGLTFHIRLM